MKVLTGSSRLVVVALLTVTTLLAACGDNTPAPAATTTAATTTTAAVVTTAAATTAATTAAAVTTAAATTAATTAAVSATTAAAGAACSTCPASYAKIALPDGLLSAAQKGLPATVTGFILEAYGTDDAIDKVALDTDASVVVSGYAFAIPGATKPVKVGDYYSGAYTKTGSPDVLISIVDVSSLPTFLKDTGADAASQQTFTTAVGTKKTIVFIFGGTGLVSSQLGGSSTTAAAGTVAPATTAATPAGADLPVYTGATLITLPDTITSQFTSSLGATVKNAKLEVYKVTDDEAKIKDFFTTSLTKDSWLDISSQLPATATASLTSSGFTTIGPFVKNPQIVFILVTKGSTLTGVSGVSATDNVYMVFRGNV